MIETKKGEEKISDDRDESAYALREARWKGRKERENRREDMR